jgi:hypothetical protein
LGQPTLHCKPAAGSCCSIELLIRGHLRLDRHGYASDSPLLFGITQLQFVTRICPVMTVDQHLTHLMRIQVE